MNRTKTRTIFTCVERDVGSRPGSLTVHRQSIPQTVDKIYKPIFVDGLQKRDFGAVMRYYFIDDIFRIVNVEVGYLVAEQLKDGTGVLIPGEVLDHDPASWSSPHLEHLALSVDHDEVAQFEMNNFMKYLMSVEQYTELGPTPKAPEVKISVSQPVELRSDYTPPPYPPAV